MQTYEPADCPQCRAGVPLAHPGTTLAPILAATPAPAVAR